MALLDDNEILNQQVVPSTSMIGAGSTWSTYSEILNDFVHMGQGRPWLTSVRVMEGCFQ